MKVILTTNIKKLGKIGDLVDVKDGFARNFLLPNKMALRENKKNIDYFEQIKEEVKQKEDQKLKEAHDKINLIKKLEIQFNKEADDKDQLYGSITKKDILNFLKDNGVNIHSDDIDMQSPIRNLGTHEIVINPYVDITHTITVKVNKN